MGSPIRPGRTIGAGKARRRGLTIGPGGWWRARVGHFMVVWNASLPPEEWKVYAQEGSGLTQTRNLQSARGVRCLVAVVLLLVAGCAGRELSKYDPSPEEPLPVSVLKAGGKWPLPGVSSGDFAKAAGLTAAIASPPIGGSVTGGALDVLGNLAERRAHPMSFVLYFAPKTAFPTSDGAWEAQLVEIRHITERELARRRVDAVLWEPGLPYKMVQYRLSGDGCDRAEWYCQVEVSQPLEPASGYGPAHLGGYPAWTGVMPIAKGKVTSGESRWEASLPDLDFWRSVSGRLPKWFFVYLQPGMASVKEGGRYRFLRRPVLLTRGNVVPVEGVQAVLE